ncbi:MAG: hypothetical protein M0P31_17830 [Solirubrobacteraceae bacterium]|nr:hypothetical protein [Solirubrobacteraceae bacterium]
MSSRRYYGLCLPRDSQARAIVEAAHGRKETASLPAWTSIAEVLERPINKGGGLDDKLDQFIVVRARTTWEALPVFCTDMADGRVRRHDLEGCAAHRWGYGGHGPHDTAFSLLVDAGNADPLPLARDGVPPACRTLVEFLCRLQHREEWCLTATDLLDLDGADLPPRW